MVKTNFHTHSVFCDGRDTPEEMALAAIEKGFSALGFSGHSFFASDADFSMSEEKQRVYREEVLRVKEKYKDKIDIFLGIEQDSWSPPLAYPYDYVIASVHNLRRDGVFCPIDHNADLMLKNLEAHFGGDQELYAEAYFAELVQLFDKIPAADVIGHVDLITKYDEVLSIRRSARYFSMAKEAVRRLAKYGKPFEINTGAIGRGYRTVPYPAPELLSVIRGEGGRIVINSDCHHKDFLDCGFDLAVDLAKDCGFSSHLILTKNGWTEVPI